MKLETIVPDPVPRNYVFTFSKEEAKVLMDICGRNQTIASYLYSGDHKRETQAADLLGSIHDLLHEEGV